MLGEHKLIYCREENWVEPLVWYVFKFWTCLFFSNCRYHCQRNIHICAKDLCISLFIAASFLVSVFIVFKEPSLCLNSSCLSFAQFFDLVFGVLSTLNAHLHRFLAFRLRSSVVSVLISLNAHLLKTSSDFPI